MGRILDFFYKATNGVPKKVTLEIILLLQLTISKKMVACRFYRDPLRAKIIFIIMRRFGG